MRINRALTGGDPVAPHLLEQTCSPEDGTGRLREPIKEIELRRGQMNLAAVSANASSRRIDEECAEPDCPLVRPGGAVSGGWFAPSPVED